MSGRITATSNSKLSVLRTAIRRFTEATFDLFVASDDVIRLFSTENIHHAKHIRGLGADRTPL